MTYLSRFTIGFALVALVALVGLVQAPVVRAEDEKPAQKTRVTATIRLAVQKKLAKAQDLSDEKQYQEAIDLLKDTMLGTSRISEFEKSRIHGFLSYIYYQTNDYENALAEQKAIVKLTEIDRRFIEEAYFAIGQLYALTNRTAEAIKVLLRLEKIKTNQRDSSLSYLISQLYYTQEKYTEGLPYIQKAFRYLKENRPEKSSTGDDLTEEQILQLTTPKEQWYHLLRAFYQQMKQYKKVYDTDLDLVYFYPNNSNLLFLAASLGLLDRNKAQLSVLELLYDRNFLDKESHLKQLASLGIVYGVPYKAAVLLEKAMQAGQVDKEKVKNLLLLARAWSEAKEDKKTIVPLRKAANLSETGKEYVLLARRYINLYQWSDAENAINLAFKKGALKDAIGARILLGQAQVELDKFDESEKTFNAALVEIKKKQKKLNRDLVKANAVKKSKRDKDKLKFIKRGLTKAKINERQVAKYLQYVDSSRQASIYLTRSSF